MEDYSKVLADNILKYRKEGEFTQDALAEKMGVSFQTVSKWETGASCPDVVRLPELADIFGITLDELFGRDAEESSKETAIGGSQIAAQSQLPWPDDDTIRAAVFEGHILLENCDVTSQFKFCLNGEAKNVVSYCNIECESIQNGATANGDINCKVLSGGANVGGDLEVRTHLSGGANVSGDLTVGGNLSSGVNCGGDATIGGNISGGATAGGDMEVSGDITGKVRCSGDLTCNLIRGNVSCDGDITYD